MKYAVGVDIGGTNSRIALVDENMNIVERTQFRTDAHDPIPTIVRLSEALKDMAGDKELVGMGVSCPGPLDLINGKVLNTPNLHDSWQDFPIAGEIEKVTDIPTYLENDANLAALAEAVVGEGRDYNYVQFLTISTGLGSSGWYRSVMAQASGIAEYFGAPRFLSRGLAWEERALSFVVREPFPSRRTQAGIVYGRLSEQDTFRVVSQMPENGVVFSDGMESDAIEFNAGTEITVEVAPKRGVLAV